MKKIFVTAVFIIGFASYALYSNTVLATPAAPDTTGLMVDDAAASPTPTPTTASPVTTAPAVVKTVPATSTPKPVARTPVSTGKYKNGTYTGSVANAYYGNIQVKATISGGKLIDVAFLQYPNDRNTSRFINEQAMPTLKAEALQAQSANVDGVSGASDSSGAFKESLGVALLAAKN
jgi:uncharacterized protein with FMN-binding domain